MAHNGLILGRSQYGKSSLAKGLCRSFRQAGRRTLVFDPLLDDWDAGYITDDRDEFLELFWGSFDLVVFVEEAGETANKREHEMVFTATRGRHQVGEEAHGHSVYYSCHRLNQLDVTLRGQCPELYLFACGYGDARDLAEDYGNREALKLAPSFLPGEFLHILPGLPAELYSVDFQTQKVTRNFRIRL